MEKKEKKFSSAEYLEIKNQALLDRETCEKEIEKDPNNIDVMLDAFSSSYEGEARLIYRASFLIPSDEEFVKFYIEHGKSANVCVEHYKGSELSDILTKVMIIEKYGVFDEEEYDVDEPEKLDLDEETVTPPSDMPDVGIDDKKGIEHVDETRPYFSPVEHLDIEEREKEVRAMFSPLARLKETDVEKQTEEALEKINCLFEKQDTKKQRITELEQETEEKSEKIKELEKEAIIKDGKISSLEGEIDRLRKLLMASEEKIDELNVENIGLHEENKALRQQSERIITAINEKYGQYEDSHDKRR